jgi:hypothetical protein
MIVIGSMILGVVVLCFLKLRDLNREVHYTNELMTKMHDKISEINLKLRRRNEKATTGVRDEHKPS